MLSNIKKITPIILFVVFFFSPKTAFAVTVTDVMPEDLFTWYTARAIAAPTTTYFGAWSIQAYQDKLYLGIGSGAPVMEDTGGIMASFDGTTLTELGDLYEQGTKGLRVSGDRVFAPGLDPTDGAWDAGNLYIYDVGDATFTALRFRESSYQYVDATTTDADGNYSFTGLKPTSYQVKFIKPVDYAFSTALVGSKATNGAIDSNPATGTGLYTICYITEDKGMRFTSAWTDDTIDAGLQSSPGSAAYTPTEGTKDMDYFTGNYTVGSKVWSDTDSDGLQDSGELGMAGVRVELYSKDPYFPCVIHNNTIYAENDGQTIYYNAGIGGLNADLVANVTFKSTDGGTTWTAIREATQYDVNNHPASDGYYAEDINRFNGYLYQRSSSQWMVYDTTYPDADTTIFYFMSWLNTTLDDSIWTHTDPGQILPSNAVNIVDGKTRWFSKPVLDDKAESFIFRDGLIFPLYGGTKFRKYTTPTVYEDITTSGISFTIIMPDWNTSSEAGMSSYNYGHGHHWQSFYPAQDEYVFAIDDQNRLFASTSLRNWVEVADFETVDSGADAITVGYWPSEEKVIVGTVGSTGSVYSILLSEVEALFTKISNSTSLTFNNPDETDLDLETIGNTGTDTTQVRHNNRLLSEVTTTFSGSTLDWSSVNGEVDVTNGKSIVTNLVTAPGAATTHTLYIPITGTGANDGAVVICPSASSLSAVTQNCSGGVTFSEGETKTVNDVAVTVTKVTYEGQAYWKAAGVNGTGGISVKKDTSPAGAPVCTNTPPDAAPVIISASAGGRTSIRLAFTDTSGNVDHYTLEYGEKSGEYKYGADNIGGAGTTQYLVAKLQPGKTYYFRIRGSNGCATGAWSKEIAAKTISSSKMIGNLDIVSSELIPVPNQTDTTCRTHKVVAADSLWSIAKKLLGDGNKYKELINLNKEKYPSLATNKNLEIGWELKTNCTNNKEAEDTEDQQKKGYSVSVKVTNTKGQPVKGANVTMHSEVQTTKTDEFGVASFLNVEEGDHRVIIAYSGYEGEQSINLSGDVKEFNLNVTVEAKNIWTSPQLLGTAIILGLVIIILVFIILRVILVKR